MNTETVQELIIRSLQGTLSEAEEARLRNWRRADLANEVQYRRTAHLWSLTARDHLRADQKEPPAAKDLFLRSPRAPLQRLSYRRAPARWYAAAVAAALVVLFVGMGLLAPESESENGFAAAEFVTGPDEMVTVRLSDGSVVRLAPQSRLRTVSSGTVRDVWLDGKAFFAVAHDERRPFTVRTRVGDALVLGTRFEVSLGDADIQVTVLEGSVALGSGEHTVQVGAGQLARAVGGNPPAVSEVDDVYASLEWLGPLMVFQSTPLVDVAAEIERRFQVRVYLPDHRLAQSTVSAWFTDQSLEEVVTVVCRTVAAHCSIRDSVVSIEP